MDSSFVKIDNVMAWDGAAAPFCETYSLFLQHPEKQWALALRFSFEIDANTENRLGVVEAFFHDASGEKLAFRSEYNLGNHDILHADKFVEVGDCFLSLADSMGSLTNGKNTIKWECVFEDPVLSYRPFPDIFYPFSFPRYKMTYPRFLNFARGQFFINHKKYEFSRIRICQTHGYGRHFPQSLSVHAVGFSEDSDAVFALFAPRFVTQRGLLPFFPCAILSMEGQVFVHQPVCTFLLRRPLELSGQGFHFVFSKRPYRFHVDLTYQSSDDFILQDTTKLNLFADLKIEVLKKNRSHWHTHKILSSSAPVTFLRKI